MVWLEIIFYRWNAEMLRDILLGMGYFVGHGRALGR